MCSSDLRSNKNYNADPRTYTITDIPKSHLPIAIGLGVGAISGVAKGVNAFTGTKTGGKIMKFFGTGLIKKGIGLISGVTGLGEEALAAYGLYKAGSWIYDKVTGNRVARAKGHRRRGVINKTERRAIRHLLSKKKQMDKALKKLGVFKAHRRAPSRATKTICIEEGKR